MIGTWVQNTSWDIFTFLFGKWATELSNMAWEWFSRLFSVPVSVVDDPLVQRLTQIAIGLVLGFLPVAIAWMVIKETVARMDGGSVSPPEALIRRAIITGLAVTGTSLVAWFMFTMADLARQTLAAVGIDINLLHFFFDASDMGTLTKLLVLLLFLVGSLILVVQRTVITAETTVLLVIGPVMAAGLIREGGQTSWNIWLRELTSLVVTGLIQMLVTQIFIRKFAGGDASPDVGPRLAAIAFLWVLWNTPRWARQMIYSVGTGDALVGSAAQVTRMVVMRKLMTAVAAA